MADEAHAFFYLYLIFKINEVSQMSKLFSCP